MKELTKEELGKLISDAIIMSDINLTLYDVNEKNVIFTTNYAYKTFGLPTSIPHSKAVGYWLENIVHPDDRKEQKRIFESGDIPEYREYRIIHPEKGIRRIGVEYKEVVKIGKRLIKIAIMKDITNK